MVGLIGILIVFIMVFGGYLAAGGKMGIIIKSLPYEMVMIGGAAAGAFTIANGLETIKKTAKEFPRIFLGARWKESDYQDLLCLLFELIKVSRQSLVELEEHIEKPNDSLIFNRFPKILSDVDTVEVICDTFRSGTMNFDDPNQVEEVIDRRLSEAVQHRLHTSHALQVMADGLPALGIVAAVLGVIKTMASIDQPPEILGKMIGGALVGTFLGVFLAYGLVGPFATRLKSVIEEDSHFYTLIRDVLVANLQQHSTNICIEVGRQNTPGHIRPSFSDLQEALRSVRN